MKSLNEYRRLPEETTCTYLPEQHVDLIFFYVLFEKNNVEIKMCQHGNLFNLPACSENGRRVLFEIG
jgi:hypothetical protein